MPDPQILPTTLARLSSAEAQILSRLSRLKRPANDYIASVASAIKGSPILTTQISPPDAFDDLLLFSQGLRTASCCTQQALAKLHLAETVLQAVEELYRLARAVVRGLTSQPTSWQTASPTGRAVEPLITNQPANQLTSERSELGEPLITSQLVGQLPEPRITSQHAGHPGEPQTTGQPVGQLPEPQITNHPVGQPAEPLITRQPAIKPPAEPTSLDRLSEASGEASITSSNKSLSQTTTSLSQTTSSLPQTETPSLTPNNSSIQPVLSDLERYVERVRECRRGGYMREVAEVMSRGYIGEVVEEMRRVVVERLRGEKNQGRMKALARAAVELGVGREVYRVYLGDPHSTGYPALLRICQKAKTLLEPHLPNEANKVSYLPNEANKVSYLPNDAHHLPHLANDAREIHLIASNEASHVFSHFMDNQLLPLINGQDSGTNHQPSSPHLAQIESMLETEEVSARLITDLKLIEALLEEVAAMSSLWIDFEASQQFVDQSLLCVDQRNPKTTNPEASQQLLPQTGNKQPSLVPQTGSSLHLLPQTVDHEATLLPQTTTKQPTTVQQVGQQLATTTVQQVGQQVDTSSEATKSLQLLLSIYVLLENRLTLLSIRQAIDVADTIESVDGSGTSTVVDDVFFILQNCVKRAVSSGDIQASCAILSQVNCVIGEEFGGALGRNLRESQGVYAAWVERRENLEPFSWTAMMEAQGGCEKGSRLSFTHSLNNVEESIAYLDKFYQDVFACFSEKFPSEIKGNLLLNHAFDELRAAKGMFEELLETGCTYALNAVKDHVARHLLPFSTTSFNLDLQTYTNLQNESAFVESLIDSLELVNSHLGLYEPRIKSRCINKLLERICQFIGSTLERKEFSLYGAVYFDENLRLLAGACGGMDSGARRQFADLFTMSDILNADSRETLEALRTESTDELVDKIAALRVDLQK